MSRAAARRRFRRGLRQRLCLYDPATDTREDIAAFEPDRTMTRLNDGRTDRQGRFIAGGFDEKNGAFISSVVRLDPDRRATKLFDGDRLRQWNLFQPRRSNDVFRGFAREDDVVVRL